MKTYPVKYSIEPGSFTQEQIRANDNSGGCESVGLISVMGKFGEGPLSTLVITYDGHSKQEWTGDQLFQIWTLIAKKIADDPTTSPGKAHLASEVFETVRSAILALPGEEAH